MGAQVILLVLSYCGSYINRLWTKGSESEVIIIFNSIVERKCDIYLSKDQRGGKKNKVVKIATLGYLYLVSDSSPSRPSHKFSVETLKM